MFRKLGTDSAAKGFFNFARSLSCFRIFEKALSRLRKNQARFSGTIAELKEERPVAPAPERERDFGLTVQNVTAEIAQTLGLKQAQGVVITAVERRSPADDAGLRRGDVILEIDRKTVRNLSEYRQGSPV